MSDKITNDDDPRFRVPMENGAEVYMEDGVTVNMVDRGSMVRIYAEDPGVREPEQLRLIRDKIAIKPDPEPERTAGGIVIPEVAQGRLANDGGFIKTTNRYHTGVVVAVGPGPRSLENGQRLPLDIKVGDRVCYERGAARAMVWTDGEIVALLHAPCGDLRAGNKGAMERDTVLWIEVPDDERPTDEPYAVEMFTSGGKQTGVFFCSKCGCVGPSQIVAQTCCAPKTCEDCGAKYDRKWIYTVCEDCYPARHVAKLQAAWDAAPKIDGWAWDGPIVTDDGEGSADGYWHGLDELRDWLEDEGLTLADVRCYATQKVPMPADAVRLIEWMAEDQHEDAYDEISSEACSELQALLDAWCEKHGTVSHVQDKNRALEFGPR
jgi:chaperonin GroES